MNVMNAPVGGTNAGILLILWVAAIAATPIGLGMYLIPGGRVRRGIGGVLYWLGMGGLSLSVLLLG